MLNKIRTSLANVLERWAWFKTIERPAGSSGYERDIPFGVSDAEGAKTLSPFYAGLDLYRRTLSTLPLVTYRRTDKGRERNRSHPAYWVLHDRVHPGMSPVTFFEILVNDYFCYGEFFAVIKWLNNNNIASLHPVPNDCVHKVE